MILYPYHLNRENLSIVRDDHIKIEDGWLYVIFENSIVYSASASEIIYTGKTVKTNSCGIQLGDTFYRVIDSPPDISQFSYHQANTYIMISGRALKNMILKHTLYNQKEYESLLNI